LSSKAVAVSCAIVKFIRSPFR